MSSSSSKSGGIEFLGILTIVFVIAKIWGKIDWSWIWVFSPIWIPFVLALTIFVVVVFILLGVAIVTAIKN